MDQDLPKHRQPPPIPPVNKPLCKLPTEIFSHVKPQDMVTPIWSWNPNTNAYQDLRHVDRYHWPVNEDILRQISDYAAKHLPNLPCRIPSSFAEIEQPADPVTQPSPAKPGRPASQPEEGAASKRKKPTDDPQPSTSGGADMATNPGTSGDTPMRDLTNRAGEQPSNNEPGTASTNAATGQVNIGRPTSSVSGSTLTFKKTHRVYTYGIAQNIISPPSIPLSDAQPRYAGTSLCYIPWDYPFMYLTPGEFAMLPDSAVCEEVTCKVFYRNTRQAFESNASDSRLAALNQANDIISAVGLNFVLDGTNLKYTTFKATEPMCPENHEIIKKDHLVALHTRIYGDESFTRTPACQFGQPIQYPLYYALSAVSKPFHGWPMLESYVTRHDANTASGSMIVNVTYVPQFGLLKGTLPAITYADNVVTQGTVQDKNARLNIDVPMSSRQASFATHTFSVGAGMTARSRSISVAAAETSQAQFKYEHVLEKSQLIIRADANATKQVGAQPWIHVGIQPCPSINTLNMSSNEMHYTDVQAYFEVECEMKISVSYPSHFPLYPIPHTRVNNALYKLKNVDLSIAKTPYMGMYRKQ